MGAGVLPVDLVDHDDGFEVQVEGFLQDELGPGEGTLGGIDEEQYAVDHRQRPLDLPAEVGMPRGVNDIDFHAVVVNGRVFGQYRDTALLFEVVRVHHSRDELLVQPERPRLPEHVVHKRRLAVIDVRNDRDVANVLSLHAVHCCHPSWKKKASTGARGIKNTKKSEQFQESRDVPSSQEAGDAQCEVESPRCGEPPRKIHPEQVEYPADAESRFRVRSFLRGR